MDINTAKEILTILKGAKKVYRGGHHHERDLRIYQHGIDTAINCVQGYVNKNGMDTQNAMNYSMGAMEEKL